MAVSGRQTGRPTLEEVAARAGVGRGTVSRVINGSPKVSEQAKAAVEQAVAELGYVPNRAARALAGSRTDAVALVIPETEARLFAEPYFLDIIRGVSAELAEADKQLLLTLIRSDQERQRFEQYLAAQRVDGVLLVSVHGDDPLPDQVRALGLPAVLNGRRSEDERVSFVDSDNTGAGRTAVAHLAARGRRSVATITGPLDMYVARCRLDGYREGLAEAGLAPDEALVANGDFTEEGGRRAMRELLDRRPGLDAVFAASDVMAAGARAVLREAGRRVPEDVALVGVDDSAVARHMDPPLTSVRQPIEEMGRTMARLLLQEIAAPGEPDEQPRRMLPTELVVRASS
ncbi:LacI family DNA-binding transcriptional regulator [Streptomyces gardneri]|uniref:LacI family transcriptional regulator n=1 Tax=Streptomyces gardneri TaxID=66892 RepID=A0A4Y3RE74_9ACTN|nr:LacI family DNA-binding transcriptional regulator [Streptomyces gardneri]ALO06550.1 LacI-family transcriptional regulatory protein [Streptomyces venezuelae]QPK43973.1 LacI family DNA-binding transcriptional regulator [Streptomyces gardneri]WRK35241.1 LacI family DNA-binding transcriptional regulator [Streptomyces venezuelae]CUM43176.1 lacI-family transcriptional regulatory protein [Streptomyces venezuelae]GEB55188.1 LacI family transcriptional regulator [Streptomyces gardneri]